MYMIYYYVGNPLGANVISAHALQTIPLFATLDEATLSDVAKQVQQRSFRPGDFIIFEGEQPDILFFVLHGRVRLSRTAADGREQILAMAGSGSMVNTVSLFAEHPNLATARAMSPVTCLTLSRMDMLDLIDRHPRLARAVLRDLSIQLRDLVVLVEDLAFRSVRERLARQLLREANEGMAELTHQELAERTGTVREIAGRALRQLAQEGLVRLARGRVTVLDHDGLARIVDNC